MNAGEMTGGGMLLVACLLAALNNGLVEYVFGTPFDRVERLQPYKWVLMYLSIITAMLIVWGLRANFVLYLLALSWPDLATNTPVAWWVTAVLSAVLIARGSNYIANLPWLQDHTAPPLEILEGEELGPKPVELSAPGV